MTEPSCSGLCPASQSNSLLRSNPATRASCPTLSYLRAFARAVPPAWDAYLPEPSTTVGTSLVSLLCLHVLPLHHLPPHTQGCWEFCYCLRHFCLAISPLHHKLPEASIPPAAFNVSPAPKGGPERVAAPGTRLWTTGAPSSASGRQDPTVFSEERRRGEAAENARFRDNKHWSLLEASLECFEDLLHLLWLGVRADRPLPQRAIHLGGFGRHSSSHGVPVDGLSVRRNEGRSWDPDKALPGGGRGAGTGGSVARARGGHEARLSPAPPPPSRVSSGKWPGLSRPRFPYLQNEGLDLKIKRRRRT